MNYEYEVEVIMFLKERIEKLDFVSSVSAKNYYEGRHKVIEDIKERLLKFANKEFEECIILGKAYFKVEWIL